MNNHQTEHFFTIDQTIILLLGDTEKDELIKWLSARREILEYQAEKGYKSQLKNLAK